ncbi:MAG: tRNA lysidine(34) synthetase TilS, partial [Clostridiales bacterium]|nr:tRNA lysidine(34) synthetase TilS [Clostridiales bacterium]
MLTWEGMSMFLLDARAYAACGLTPETQVLAAVSGGSDSTALLLELHRLVREGKIKRVAGAHINHGIRDAEAQRDEAFVWRLCRRLEIENFTARVSVPAFAQRTGMSLEHAAREMRYKHLRQIKAERGFDCIAVAHHQSDQAETILQHAIRGCGLNGLVGMKTVSGDIVRPLLDVSKAEILAFLAEGNHPFLEDSTNMEPYAQRNRLRQRVIPELVRENPQAIEHLCRTASFLAEDEAYLTGLAKAARTECGENRKAIARLPKPVRKRVLMALLAERDVEVSADTVMRLDELLLARTGVRIPLSDGFCAWTENDNLRLGKLSELETYDLPLEIGQVCALKTGRLLVTKAAAAALP